jgi:hypothetical protein
VTAIAVTVATFTGFPRGADVTGPPTATTAATPSRTATVTGTPSPGTGVSQIPAGVGYETGEDIQAGIRLFTKLLTDMRTSLDPHQAHLVWDPAALVGEGISHGDTKSMATSALWMQKAEPVQGLTTTTQPCVQVTLEVDSPQVPDGIGTYEWLFADGTALRWQHKGSTNLSDGSTITWAWTSAQAGTEMAVSRMYADGRHIEIRAIDDLTGPGAARQRYEPFPFTTTALAAVISDPTFELPGFP